MYLKKKSIALVSVLLLAGVVAATSHPDYVPDTGYYSISKSYAYSDFIWKEQGFDEWYPEAYEHEFRVENTGFAKYAGYWSSNLPQKYLDLEDDSQNSENQWDEFVVGSDDAEATVPGQEYWTYIDLSDQDSSVTSTRTILEAELNWDLPGTGANWPMEWYTIRDFTAPDSGTWDFTSGSSASNGASVIQSRRDADEDEDIDSYISKRKEVLKKLAEKMPEREMAAMVSLSSFASAVDGDVLLRDYKVEARAAWFEALNHGFGGGFSIEGSVAVSLAREIGDLQEDLARTRKALKNDPEENAGLKKVIKRQEMMIHALSTGGAKVYGIQVKGKLKELQRLQGDGRVTLVDVKYYPDAPKGARIVQRPIQPER